MSLRKLLGIFSNRTNEYITKVEYEDESSYKITVEKYDDELEELYTIDIILFEDGTNLIKVGEYCDRYLNEELVRVALGITTTWKDYVNDVKDEIDDDIHTYVSTLFNEMFGHVSE